MIPAILAAAIGALGNVAGAGIDAYNSKLDREHAEKLANEKAARVKAGADEAKLTYEDIERQLDDFYKGQPKYTTPEMRQEYQDMISGFDPSKFVLGEDAYNFGYDKTVNDFMTPYMDDIISSAMNKVQRSAAGAGLGRSAGTAQEMLDVGAETKNDLYRTAMNDYNNDRDFNYRQFSDYINNMQNRMNTLSNLTGQKISMLGGALQHDEQNASDYMSDLLSIAQDKAKTAVNAGAWS